jgi:cobalt-zinc-cadmium efflux system membrane fusion protein
VNSPFVTGTRARLLGGIGLLAACALGFVLARVSGRMAVPVAPAPAVRAVSSNTLRIPNSYLAIMGIATVVVAPGNLSAEIQAPATVSAAANGQAIVTAHAGGTVSQLRKRLGDPVQAGEVLALVESRDGTALAAERSVAESRVALARSALKREQHLFQQGVTPRQDLESAEAQAAAAEAEAARASAVARAAFVSGDGHSLAVVSPIAGRITAANVTLGAFVQPETELFRVADPRFVLIEAAVTAADAARITAGDTATVTTASGTSLAAAVQSVTPTLSEQTRAATVVLTLSHHQSAPTPGEFVQVHITPRQSGTVGFVVGEEAVQRVDNRDVVFLRTDQGFQVRPVTVGLRSGGRVLILAGLSDGQVIATQNAFLLKAELSKSAGDDE